MGPAVRGGRGKWKVEASVPCTSFFNKLWLQNRQSGALTILYMYSSTYASLLRSLGKVYTALILSDGYKDAWV